MYLWVCANGTWLNWALLATTRLQLKLTLLFKAKVARAYYSNTTVFSIEIGDMFKIFFLIWSPFSRVL